MPAFFPCRGRVGCRSLGGDATEHIHTPREPRSVLEPLRRRAAERVSGLPSRGLAPAPGRALRKGSRLGPVPAAPWDHLTLFFPIAAHAITSIWPRGSPRLSLPAQPPSRSPAGSGRSRPEPGRGREQSTESRSKPLPAGLRLPRWLRLPHRSRARRGSSQNVEKWTPRFQPRRGQTSAGLSARSLPRQLAGRRLRAAAHAARSAAQTSTRSRVRPRR